jgi:phosphohistidine phosphatase SixA
MGAGIVVFLIYNIKKSGIGIRTQGGQIMNKYFLIPGLLVCVFIVQGLTVAEVKYDQERLWAALRSKKHFALIRHALAPGTGDPPEFTLGRRETQRNLSREGREQARRIGDLFRDNGIMEARVFSSEWYRCRETAGLLDLGPVILLSALNSFFGDYEERKPRTESLKLWLSRQDMDGPLVLVTHQVNITALTGVFPSSGEIVVVKKDAQGEMEVLGSIKTR